MLDVKSTSKGILVPRMTMSQRNGIPSPATGLLVFVNDDNTFYFWSGSAWVPIVSALKPDNDWTISGNNIYSAVSGNVGIGTPTPGKQLELTQSLKIPATTSNSTGIIFKGDVPFLHDYRGSVALGFNTFLGVDAGNFTSGGGSDWQGCNNTGIGYYSLHAVTVGYANTAVGSFALPSLTTGYENTAVGLQSMNANVGGARNTAMGYMASHENTSGSNNISIGYNANYYNQTGSNNTILGCEAGKASALHNKTGNVFIGYQAGFSETGSNKLYIENSNTTLPLIGGDFNLNEVYINGKLRIADGTQVAGRILQAATDGTASWADPATISDGDWTISGSNMYSAISGNVGIGTSSPGQQLEITAAMKMPATTSSTTGVIYKGSVAFIHDYKGPIALGFNTFIGQDAGNFTMGGGANYLGCNNTGMGYNALHGVTFGYANTGVGAFSLSGTTTGVENTAVGLHSMIANTGGSRNTALGYMAGRENVGGNDNTAIGYNANYYNQAGGNNTIIGCEAGKGSALHNKTGNVFLGYQAGFNETGNNKLYIENTNTASPLIGGDFILNEVYMNGKLGIGTMTPDASSILDLTSTTKGLLLPRMTTAQRTAILSPIDGLMVYDTDIDATYLYRNGAWSPDLNGSSGWTLTGNSGTSPASNFIGTTDNAVLKFRVNNSLAGIIDHTNYNTGLGYQTLNALATGRSSTSIGCQSLYSNTTGFSNIAIGIKSLYSNTTRSNLVAIGDSALFNNGLNVIQGWHATLNTAVGSKALFSNTTGAFNTAIGNQALYSNTTARANTAVGANSLLNSTGEYNTAVGYESLKSNTGDRNVAIGPWTLGVNGTGELNIAMGNAALGANSSGSYNVALGGMALITNSGGAYNTSSGYNSMYANTGGSHNTAVGNNALQFNTTGTYNTAIGDNTGPLAANLFNTCAIGYNAQPTAGSRIHIGNTSVAWIGGQVSWGTYSDGRAKRDIIENIPGLDFVLALRPVSYKYDIELLDGIMGVIHPADELACMKQARVDQEKIVYSGFIAQEVEAAAKKCGYDFSGLQAPVNEHTPYSLRYAEFVVPLVKAVQEQQAIIEKQQNQISELLKRVEALERE